jgi:hypothetical protein
VHSTGGLTLGRHLICLIRAQLAYVCWERKDRTGQGCACCGQQQNCMDCGQAVLTHSQHVWSTVVSPQSIASCARAEPSCPCTSSLPALQRAACAAQEEKEQIAQEKYGKSYSELSTNEQKVGRTATGSWCRCHITSHHMAVLHWAGLRWQGPENAQHCLQQHTW